MGKREHHTIPTVVRALWYAAAALLNGTGALHVIEGNMNGEMYQDTQQSISSISQETESAEKMDV